MIIKTLKDIMQKPLTNQKQNIINNTIPEEITREKINSPEANMDKKRDEIFKKIFG